MLVVFVVMSSVAQMAEDQEGYPLEKDSSDEEMVKQQEDSQTLREREV